MNRVSTTPSDFDPLGPLPTGTTVLEASAGTGKTWTIATLTTRYVAEGVVDLTQVLLATFGNAATQELRERVRERLTSTALALADPAGSVDPLVQLLADGCAAQVAERGRRLARAVSDFDAATIVTTHSFCAQMLDTLGMAGDLEAGVRLVESTVPLQHQVVDDLFLRKYGAWNAAPPQMSPEQAWKAVSAAVTDRQARLEPADADPASPAGQRVGLARAARHELERRKRAQGVRDYDDLLSLLRAVLCDPEHGPAACARLRDRFRVVLVDEFQDTDPVQWEILRTAFHGHAAMTLIGDPKQAIYAFRGAEVRSYLAAVAVADRHQSLAVNWRSDADLVAALDSVYGGAALGDPQIVVAPVRAAHEAPRLHGVTPLRLRVLARSGELNNRGFAPVARGRTAVATDLAAQVVELLSGPAELLVDGPPRSVQPADIAVLVRTHTQAALVGEQLRAVQVPCVSSGSASIFTTDSARDWLRLLQAVEQPHRASRVRLAALTPPLGWTLTGLDSGGDAALERAGALVRETAERFREVGAAAVLDHLARRTGLEARLLSRPDGERRLTDLRHLAAVLHRVGSEQSLGLTALVGWLEERLADPDGGGSVERSRRLDSDAAAVQILTTHTCKGLEFPVVLVPFGWDSVRLSDPVSLSLHDGATRLVDVGGSTSPGFADRKRLAEAEDDAEALRLFYVAATRAQCGLVLWWAPAATTSVSPLHRLLFGRLPGQAEPAASPGVPEDREVAAHLRAWAVATKSRRDAADVSLVAVEPVVESPPRVWTPPAHPLGPLAVRTFDRPLDTTWRRTSYSALTAAAHDLAHPAAAGSEPEQTGPDDEPAEPPPAPGEPQPPTGPPSTMNDLPAGAAFGTLVHEVLETLDTGDGDLSDAALAVELQLRCRRAVARRSTSVDPLALAQALLPVLRTPLPGGGSLAALPSVDRLAELDFELPLSALGRPAATIAALAGLLRTGLPGGSELAGYPDLLEQVDAPDLRGFLTGSIDAVLRLPGLRFVVVDYKTNRLARGELTALHYQRAPMAAEMLRSHYVLQALLYAVALHRFLRWRQPGYDPDRHLGGVQYLFVRGMVGPRTPDGCGVYDWMPPAALVVETSNLLAGLLVRRGQR